jgi:hypothetical protein
MSLKSTDKIEIRVEISGFELYNISYLRSEEFISKIKDTVIYEKSQGYHDVMFNYRSYDYDEGELNCYAIRMETDKEYEKRQAANKRNSERSKKAAATRKLKKQKNEEQIFQNAKKKYLELKAKYGE